MASRAASPANSVAFAVGCLGIAFFSAMDAVMKELSIAIGAYNAVFWRMLVGVVLSGSLFLAARTPWPSWPALRLHLLRGFIGAFMAFLFFWGIARMPLAEAIALCFIAPLIALYLAAAILGEPVGRRAIAASAIGFSGVVVIASARGIGGSETDILAVGAVLTSALLYAYNIILMRQQAQLAGPVEIAFSQNVVMAAVLGIAAPAYAVLPDPVHLPGLMLAAALALASLLLLAWAYARAEAQRLAAVEYTSLLWAALFGFLMFGERVAVSTFIGAALIVAGCIIAARAERRPLSPIEAAP